MNGLDEDSDGYGGNDLIKEAVFDGWFPGVPLEEGRILIFFKLPGDSIITCDNKKQNHQNIFPQQIMVKY